MHDIKRLPKSSSRAQASKLPGHPRVTLSPPTSRRGTIQWKGGSTWASCARAHHRLDDPSHRCAQKQLLQSGHCQLVRYRPCRRAAILKTGRVWVSNTWGRRRWLVRMVSARVSLSKFAHLRAAALGVAPIPTVSLSLSPVVLSLCL